MCKWYNVEVATDTCSLVHVYCSKSLTCAYVSSMSVFQHIALQRVHVCVPHFASIYKTSVCANGAFMRGGYLRN